MRQKNVVHNLQVDGTVISDHAAIAEAAFQHFEGLLGTSVGRDFSLNLDFLGIGVEDLSYLDKEF
jgi:hypothetical protein